MEVKVKCRMHGLRGRDDWDNCDDPRGGHLTHPGSEQSRSSQSEYVEVKCCLGIYRGYILLWSSFNRKQHTKKQEDKTATKMFSVTLFLVLSISMLTQSAPAADPEPQECQPIKEPYTHCALKCSECEPDCITLFREVYPCWCEEKRQRQAQEMVKLTKLISHNNEYNFLRIYKIILKLYLL